LLVAAVEGLVLILEIPKVAVGVALEVTGVLFLESHLVVALPLKVLFRLSRELHIPLLSVRVVVALHLVLQAVYRGHLLLLPQLHQLAAVTEQKITSLVVLVVLVAGAVLAVLMQAALEHLDKATLAEQVLSALNREEVVALVL
jgi:hypothetical protein